MARVLIVLAGVVMTGFYWWAAAPVHGPPESAGALKAAPWLIQSTYIVSSLETGHIGYVEVHDGHEFTDGFSYALNGQPTAVVVDGESGALSLDSQIPVGLHTFELVATDGAEPNRVWRFPLVLDVRKGVTAGRTGDQILHKIYDVDLGQYGRPDGDNYTDVLFNIRKAVIEDQQVAGDGNLRATIYFRRGKTYDYTVNNWLTGLQYVTVEPDPEYNRTAPRPQLRNVRSSFVFDNEIAILQAGGGSTVFDHFEEKLKVYSPPIHSVAPGQSRVRLKDAADAALIKVGRWYLIGSYDQQLGGFPPNMRYFDYVRVSVVAGDEIVLDRRLKHHHRDDYFEESANPSSLGLARIIPLDLGGKGGLVPTLDARLAIRLTIKSVEFVQNPSTSDFSKAVVYFAGALDVSVEDCLLPHPVPTIVQHMRFLGGTIESSEPDKLVSALILDRVESGQLVEATGLDLLLIRDSRVAPLRVSPRRLRVHDSVIDATSDTHLWYPVTYAYYGPILSAQFKSVVFKVNPEYSDPRVMPAIERPSVVVGREAMWNGDTLVIPRSSPVFVEWQISLFEGMIVYSEQDPGNWGVVTRLSSTMDGGAIWATIDWRSGKRPATGKLVAGRGHRLRIDDKSKLVGSAGWDSLSGGFMWQHVPRQFGLPRPAVPANVWNSRSARD